MRFAALLLTVFLSVLTVAPRAHSFNCSSTSTCQALVDYVSPNATTVGDVLTLFGVKDLYTLLGANSWPLSTSLMNRAVAKKEKIKIPFPCICANGTGISNKVPVYKVKPQDGLDHIARDVFAALMTYQEIAEVNEIPNPDLIDIGQELKIPLPCSCDDVHGAEVVHYGHVVDSGSSVEQIAQKYGSDQETLLKLNGLSDPKDLKAGAVLDVPLRACTSQVVRNSSDYPLRLSNGTYTLTANNCVNCKCDSSNNWMLHCEQSQITPTNWSKCPSMQCDGGLNLGSGAACSTCAYAGYNNRTIATVLSNNCTGASPSNYAPKIGLQGSGWSLLLISLGLGFLCFVLL